jgi:RNA polymerase sigma-70 factor, ECF subfamily
VIDGSTGDAQLLQLAATGDDAAFALFVSRHQDGVWRRARALTQQAADAEDLLQETFVSAWRGASGFRGDDARSWLLTIAAHAWQRTRRRPHTREEDADADTLELLAARAAWGAIAPESPTDPEAIITVAFARLTPEDRELLTLRDIESLPGEAVAGTLGLSVAAMKSRLHRARLRLAAAYEEVRRGSA